MSERGKQSQPRMGGEGRLREGAGLAVAGKAAEGTGINREPGANERD